MRTGALVLLAQHCVESADESADWSLYAFWLASCTTGAPPPPHEPQPSFRTTGPPPASCDAFCVVWFLLPAAEMADELLVCSTEPSSPSEPMRTGMLTFFGWSCSDVADESADWWLY